jgi:hypothetical protein
MDTRSSIPMRASRLILFDRKPHIEVGSVLKGGCVTLGTRAGPKATEAGIKPGPLLSANCTMSE